MSIPSEDLNVAFLDNNLPQTWPSAVNAYTYTGQWMMSAASDVCTGYITFHFDGVPRRYTLISLKDVQIKYEPYFDHNGYKGKAFLVIKNRQLMHILGGKIFQSLTDVANNIGTLMDEVVSMMHTPGLKAISVSNRTPLQQLSEYAVQEVIPIQAFYFKKPKLDI